VNAVGTGLGGLSAKKGHVYTHLLPVLRTAAVECEVDIAIVCWGPRAYSAAQWARRHLIDELDSGDISATWRLGPRLTQDAERIAGEARRGRLTLFLGAGASAGAGLPTWKELLKQVSEQTDLSEEDRGKLEKLDLRDQAEVVSERLASSDPKMTFSEVVNGLLNSEHYSLTQALLASLECNEAVTTNFDGHYERAVHATAGSDEPGKALAVLPWNSVTPSTQKWLLKLHGSAERKELTLTRTDYLTKTHGALFGIVQALLLTRHMLFVGYSMSDEDFHQLIHEVLDSRRGVEEAGKMGTALSLSADPLLDGIRGKELDIVSMSQGTTDDQTDLDAARQLQIFLDLVAYLSAVKGTFLLDGTYEGLLRQEERELVAALHGLESRVRDVQSPAADMVRDFLSRMGSPSSHLLGSDSTLVVAGHDAVPWRDDEQRDADIGSRSGTHMRQTMTVAALDRARGALLGLATGDAVGTTLEFKRPASFAPIDDMVGGGPFGLKAGMWTDDTSMALCLAESVLDTGGMDLADQLRRYLRWADDGYLSSNGRCFDIGGTTRHQLERFRRTGAPTDPHVNQDAAANGSLMRLAGVPIRWHGAPALAADRSAEVEPVHPSRSAAGRRLPAARGHHQRPHHRPALRRGDLARLLDR
jgi:hypothetical protein